MHRILAGVLAALLFTFAVQGLPAAQAQVIDQSFQPQVKAIQQKLKDLGWYYGSVDGIIGPGTMRAANNYRRAAGLPQSDTLDSELLNTLEIVKPNLRPAPAPVPSQTVRDVQVRLQALGYYDGPIDGLAGPKTAAAARAYRQAKGIGDSGTVDQDLLYILRQ